MSTPWKLYNEVSKQTPGQLDYQIFRCPDPVTTTTSDPWYPVDNSCPCDPNLSNTTGRGFTACPFGLTIEQPSGSLLTQASFPQNKASVVGNLYSQGQYVPPQLEPRPISRIGMQWRSSN